MMVFGRICFLIFLNSMLCISTLGFPEIVNNGNNDCRCIDSNLGKVGASDSWTWKLSKVVLFSGQTRAEITGVILVMIVLNIIVYMLRELHETNIKEDKKPLSLSLEHLCRQFRFAEMQSATNNFDEAMIVGKGGFGKVYRGVIDNGATRVAIKRSDSKSKQGTAEFWTEIKLLSKARHSHLVSLIGYCDEFDDMIIVYEYVPGGNLGERLHKADGSAKKYPLMWVERLKICIGAARGLDYLHTGTGVSQRIIHRDVKSSNILLDEYLTAKVSDLGISKIGLVDQPFTHVSTNVKGSFGYFDPNYFMTRRLSRKSDVYSFGVVLLEVLCGRPVVDPSLGDNELGLVAWAQYRIKEGMLMDIIDANLMRLTPNCSRMRSQINPDCLKEFIEITGKCLRIRPNERPTMTEVVVALEAALTLQEKPPAMAFESYDNQQRANSYTQSGKIITFSRMLRNIFPLKTPVRSAVIGDVEQLEKKKRLSNCFLPSTLSKRESKETDQYVISEGEVLDSALKLFTLAGLKIATRNFSDDMVLGVGAFGKVFKGWVDQETYVPSRVASGKPIAVKKLDTDGFQGLEEWQAEVKILGRLSHPNLVKLLGYCSEDQELLLVYEFMQKGSLENYILKKGFGQSLSWSVRIKIMIGIAQGVAYLHTTENQIIFRDLKSSNILLDEDFTAKIADFGLARRGPINGDTHLSTQVMGTYGYAAPEYVATGHLNGKNDIYSFGVVLLETLTGLRVFDKTRATNEQNLVEWVWPMLSSKRKLKTIVDPSLGRDYPLEAAFKSAALILKCLQPEPKERPSIEQVLQSLEHINGIKQKLFKGRG